MAALAALDLVSSRIAPLLARSKGMAEAQARVAANALAFGYSRRWNLGSARIPRLPRVR
jgi:hypothetical protein